MRTWFANLLLAATIYDHVYTDLYAKLLINAYYCEFEDDQEKEWNPLVTGQNGFSKTFFCRSCGCWTPTATAVNSDRTRNHYKNLEFHFISVNSQVAWLHRVYVIAMFIVSYEASRWHCRIEYCLFSGNDQIRQRSCAWCCWHIEFRLQKIVILIRS